MRSKQFLIFAGLVIVAVQLAQTSDAEAKRVEPTKNVRIKHAKELLGTHYNQSVVRFGENHAKIEKHIFKWTKENLPKKFKKDSKRIARAIMKESKNSGYDPIFLMAVIQGESSFDPEKKGKYGEFGLMQVKPDTAQWIGKKANIKWKGEKSLLDPVQNIRYGVAYLNWLRDKFDLHAQLYLAAYNMGQRNVNKALSKNVWPKDYPNHVMTRYIDYYRELRKMDDIKEPKLAVRD